MTQEEAEKLARKWFAGNGIGFDDARVARLARFIVEIENAAYERAAKLIDRQEKTARKGTDSGAADRELAYRVMAASIRALVTPPAQKENGR